MPTAARGRGLRVIIAGAGGAAHLPGMCAAWTPLPVLGVPVEIPCAQGHGQPAVDRPDAGRHPGRHAGDRPRRRGQRRPAGRRHPGRHRSRAGRAAWMPGAPRQTEAVAPAPVSGADATVPAAAERHDRHRRRRPARPHVGDGRRPARLSLPHPDARGRQPGRAGRRRRSTLATTRTRPRCAPSPPQVDVITFEFENVSAEGLDLLASLKPVRPSPAMLRVSQDRIVGEEPSSTAPACPPRPGEPIRSLAELEAAVGRIGLPAVLKTTRLGYDGKGQAMLRTPDDLKRRLRRAGSQAADPGGLRRFRLRDQRGRARAAPMARSAAFDAVENRHRDHILDVTLAPARIAPAVAGCRAGDRPARRRRARPGRPAGGGDVRRRDGSVLVNEIAPRPHNSGHWTIDACPASQFELHIRAIAGLPLPPAVRHSDAVMKNLVGPEETALLAGDPGHPRPDPASVRQGGGPPGPQDGPRDAPVSARHPAGRGSRNRGRNRAGDRPVARLRRSVRRSGGRDTGPAARS